MLIMLNHIAWINVLWSLKERNDPGHNFTSTGSLVIMQFIFCGLAVIFYFFLIFYFIAHCFASWWAVDHYIQSFSFVLYVLYRIRSVCQIKKKKIIITSRSLFLFSNGFLNFFFFIFFIFTKVRTLRFFK